MCKDEAMGSAPHASSTFSRRAIATLVWTFWASLTLADFIWVGRYGLSVPFMDDWSMVPALAGHESADWRWAWAQHNEHRFVLTRPLLLWIYRLAGGDFRAAVYVNVALLSAAAALLVWTASRVRGRTALTDAFFPLVLLHFGQSENLIWSWQLVYILPVTVAIGMLALIVRFANGSKRDGTWSVGLCLLALSLCGGVGLVYLPTMSLWAAVCLSADWRQGRRFGALMLGVLLSLTALIAGLYFVGYRASGLAQGHSDLGLVGTLFQVLAVAFGLVDTRYWWLWGALTASYFLAAIALAVHVSLKEPGERRRALGLLVLLVSVLAMASAIAWGRGGLGLFGRYTTLLAPGLCTIYFVGLLYGQGRVMRWLPLALFLTSAAMLERNTRLGLEGAGRLHDGAERFLADLRSGWPPMALADRYSRYPFMLFSEKQSLDDWLTMLHDAGIGPFRHMRPDPAFQVVSLSSDQLSRGDDNHFALKTPRFVYAVRLKYSYEPMAPTAIFRFAWHGATRDEAEKSVEFVLRQTPGENSLLVWIDATLSRFAVYPDNKPCRCSFGDIELLVPLKDGEGSRK
jgi:hypothetical protein